MLIQFLIIISTPDEVGQGLTDSLLFVHPYIYPSADALISGAQLKFSLEWYQFHMHISHASVWNPVDIHG